MKILIFRRFDFETFKNMFLGLGMLICSARVKDRVKVKLKPSIGGSIPFQTNLTNLFCGRRDLSSILRLTFFRIIIKLRFW